MFESIEPEAFRAKTDNGELGDALVLDVREPYEWEYYHWEQAQLMPMNSIPGRLAELPKDRTIYIVCAHGIRSANVCYYLKQNGFDDVINIDGGMAALAALRGFQYDE